MRLPDGTDGPAVSDGLACRDRGHRDFWVVVIRNAHYSAFSGNRRTWSPYSLVRCTQCGAAWRTKAAFVSSLPDRRTM